MAKTQSVYDVHPSVAMMQSWVAELNTSLRVPDHPRTDCGKSHSSSDSCGAKRRAEVVLTFSC